MRYEDFNMKEHGFVVSLFGAEGLPDAPNQVPLDMFIPAVKYLREKKGIEHISVYGQSMGSIFAVLFAATLLPFATEFLYGLHSWYRIR